MKCPQCKYENREDAKFCKNCGTKLELTCPSCGHAYEQDSVFCDQCGQRLGEAAKAERPVPEVEGERKHVTVLFSDLSGYTAMTEMLDPEEAKDIMSWIFGEIAQVIAKYEGFIERFIGDAVMALFGVPKVHEDDPVRAIKAAREIHSVIEDLSPKFEKKVGRPLSMHTGINTGLVVTGEVNLEKGTHGITGDTINLASRLQGLARAGEILVGEETHRQTEGYFDFEPLEPTKVKGKEKPVQPYRLLSVKAKPVTIHRLSGLRAELIGRKVEITHLREAVENLRKGKGRIFSICGDAGTGKSRLVEEFKTTLDPAEFQWLEGHAYAYSQNIAYCPLIDLLNRVFQIEEDDPQEKVRKKVESVLENLLGKKADIVLYVGSLYSLSYPELEDVSPEFWKSRLQEATQTIISALAHRAPTIFFLEDLHWSDPSFVELLRHLLLQIRQPVIVLCLYRPEFSLFTSHQLSSIGEIYQEFRLQDLSPSHAQDMLVSLLETETIPTDLKRFVQNKAEGNPFYLEELINSLIETETLIRDNGSWKTTRSITESDISSTVHGLISGRLDRLEKETKRILQEASVIGRAFPYEILKRITEQKDRIDRGLNVLERLDLIRTRSIQPDLEYMFKHPLTQEVVYKSLLKKERQAIHEQIAIVMEQFFQDRLPEFYETLAVHFKQGQSIDKAVDYLMKSGEKSLKRYAVEESHHYYQQAFYLLTNKPDRTKEEDALLIDLLFKWALVFYYRGHFRGLVDLFSAYRALAESLEDKARLGMFYAWLGFAWHSRGKIKDSYQYLSSALKIGEEIQNEQLIGYACAWLGWTCSDFGLLKEGINFAQRAQEISKSMGTDQYLYFKSLAGLARAYEHRGDTKKALAAGKALLEYGQTHANVRSLVMGHVSMGYGYFLDGDLSMSMECSLKAIQISVDPYYSQIAKMFLGISHLLEGRVEEAEEALSEVVNFSQEVGAEGVGAAAQAFLGAALITRGKMSQGLEMLEKLQRTCLENGRKWVYVTIQLILGRAHLEFVKGEGPERLSSIAKNIGFLVKNTPSADKKSKRHFNKAIEVSKEIGARGILGRAYLDLGLLHRAKKRTDKARECLSAAIEIFEQCEADNSLKQAKEALASL